MAIDLDTGDYVEFTIDSDMWGAANRSYSVWIYVDAYTIDSVNIGDTVCGEPATALAVGGLNGFFVATNCVLWLAGFSTMSGCWSTPDGSLSTGAYHHIVVTYNAATGSDPVIYIDGVSQAITERITPSGSFFSETGYTAYVGSNYGMDGRVQDFRRYNKILSAEEVSALYSLKSKSYTPSGLVFHALFEDADGIASFDGAALASSNVLRDRIANRTGVPSGSPVGRGFVQQSYYVASSMDDIENISN